MKTLSGKRLLDSLGIDYFYRGASFGALSKDAILFLINGGEVIEYLENELIYDAGDKSDSFYIVISGKIDFYKLFEGEWFLISEHRFGEQLGYVGMIGLHDRVGRALAVEKSILLKVTSELFGRMHETYPMDFGILLLNSSREMARTIVILSKVLAENKINYPKTTC